MYLMINILWVRFLYLGHTYRDNCLLNDDFTDEKNQEMQAQKTIRTEINVKIESSIDSVEVVIKTFLTVNNKTYF